MLSKKYFSVILATLETFSFVQRAGKISKPQNVKSFIKYSQVCLSHKATPDAGQFILKYKLSVDENGAIYNYTSNL